MQNQLVTILAPCYNGQMYVEKFLDSVLGQTYPNIELVFVNDGSTDKTEGIVESYCEKFKAKGFNLIYVYKTNGGQASAINEGLKHFNGEYLTWIDSDDIMLPDSIKDKIDFLEKNPDCGFVLGKGVFVKAGDEDKAIGDLQRIKPEGEDKLFEDLIMENNVVFGPGTIMVRRESILKAIPNLKIFESKEGQNWQLMLPLAYHCKCGYLNKVGVKIVMHNDSHSRSNRNLAQKLKRTENFEILLDNTIDSIPKISNNEKNYWKKIINEKYCRRKLDLYYSNCQFKEARKIRKEISEKGYSDGVKNSYFAYCFKRIINKIRQKF